MEPALRKLEEDTPARHAASKRSTLVSVAVNIMLSTGQIAIGFISGSQGLVADGIHSLLIANAWHARSDAASSLVVAGGIVGNLLGYPLLDPVAALVVGLMVARMGWNFAWSALGDLMDRAVDAETLAGMRAMIEDTPGCWACMICIPARWPTSSWSMSIWRWLAISRSGLATT